MAAIERLAKSIRIIWYEQGKKQKETLNIEPTKENITYAENLAKLIQLELDTGKFDRSRHFPESSAIAASMFEVYIDAWVSKNEGSVAPSSWHSYTSHINNHIKPYFGKMNPEQITAAMVEVWVTDELMPALANKTIREVITRLRKIWQYWAVQQNKSQLMDPTSSVTIRLPDPDDIDPFTKDEIKIILEQHTTRELHNLWTCLLWSGLSMHELCALAVEDIDLHKGVIHVKRSCVRGHYRVTKTRRRKRSVQILQSVAVALAAQMSIVQFFPKHMVEVLDRDNRTVRPQYVRWLWLTEDRSTHLNYDRIKLRWQSHLKECGVRYRAPNNGRHTYASQLLTSGHVSAEWLAQQLGHSSTAMIHKHYGKFIRKDDPGYIEKLNDHLFD